MASVKIAELLEKYKALEERSNALRVQVARDEARRESDQRQYDEILQQLQERFQTRDLGAIREKIEQEKQAIYAELLPFEESLSRAEVQRETCQKALAEIDAAAS